MVVTYRPTRTSFDLAHLDTLSDAPNHILFVSERTLYLLQNLSSCDISDESRYAIEVLPTGDYVPVRPDDSEYALAQAVIEQAQLELIDETDTMIDWLDNISHRVAPVKAVALQTSYTAVTTGWFTIDTGTPAVNDLWRIPQIAVRITSGATSDFYVFVGATAQPNMIIAGGTPLTSAFRFLMPDLTIGNGQYIKLTAGVTTAPCAMELTVYRERYLISLEQ